VPAKAIEDLAQAVLTRLAGGAPTPLAALARVEIYPTTVRLVVRGSVLVRSPPGGDGRWKDLQERLGPGERLESVAADDDLVDILVPCRLKFSGGRIWITGPDGLPKCEQTRQDAALISALQEAHALLAADHMGELGSPEDLTLNAAPANPYRRELIRMAFLAPDIQADVLHGRQPPRLNRQRLVLGDVPLAWADQRALFRSC
jgi:site-specific DNA recombinase